MTTTIAATTPDTGRVALWDNARFVAVTLVVMGHALQRLTSHSDSAFVVYLFIYGFHIPAFAIISGYFSKSTPPTLKQLKRLLTDLVVPYVIFEAIWSVIQFLVTGYSDFNPTTASWTLWFLLALATFRLVLPYLALLRWPLLWAIGFSVGVGYLSNVGSTFSLSRTIGLLPFFVLGWKLREWGAADRWVAARASVLWIRAAAVLVFAAWLGVIVAFLVLFRKIDLQHWLFFLDPYSAIADGQWWAGLVRLGFIVLAVVLSIAFLALVPRRRTWITDLGQATMYVYLLHTFVLYPVRESGILSHAQPANLWLIGMMIAAVAISLALASPVVRRIFRPLVEPKLRWLYAREEPPQ